MSERPKNVDNFARTYLRQVESIRQWMNACLEEQLPPAIEFEESMRNGVYLARLANYFAPDIAMWKF